MDASPSFSELARLLCALDGPRERRPTKERRSKMLQQFFQRHLPTGADTSTVCAVFALLLPAEDNRRYHLKESRLAQAVVTALRLGGSFAAQRLLDWQDPAAGEEEEEEDGHGRGEAQRCGDLSALVAEAVKERVGTGRERLSVTEVHAELSRLADGDREPPPTRRCPCGRGACAVFTATTSKHAGRRFFKCPAASEGGCNFFQWCGETPLHGGGGALARMLRRCSAVEAQWLVRIILREMRIGGEACGRDTERAEWPRLVMEAFRAGLYRFYLRQRDLPAAAEKAEHARRADAAAHAAAAAGTAARACAGGTGAAAAPAGSAGAAHALGAAACSLEPRVRQQP